MVNPTFFDRQLDFILFLTGIAFTLLAFTCASIHREKGRYLPWGWFGAASVFFALSNWSTILFAIYRGSPSIKIAFFAIEVASLVCFLEFARRGWRAVGGKAFGPWIHMMVPLVLLLGALNGPGGLVSASAYLLAIPLGLWASVVLYRASNPTRVGSRNLVAASLFTGLFVISAGLIITGDIHARFELIHETGFRTWAGFPIQLIWAVLAILVMLSIWRYYTLTRKRDESATRISVAEWGGPVFAILLLAYLGIGWSLVEKAGRTEQERFRNDILTETTLACVAVDLVPIQRLAQKDADRKSADHSRLQEQLRRMQEANPGSRRFYVLALHKGFVVFLADSLRPDDPGYQAPGTVLPDPPPGLKRFFQEPPVPAAILPMDTPGTLASGFAPIRDAQDRHTIAVIGIDPDAEFLQRSIAHVRANAIVLLLAFGLLFITFYWFYQKLTESTRVVRDHDRRMSEAQRIAHVGNWTYDPEEDRVTWSEELCRIFGFLPGTDPPDFEGHRPLLHPEDWAIMEGAVQETLRTGRGYRVEFRIIRPDGELRHIVARGEAVCDGSQKVLRLIGTLEDVTEQKRINEALEQANRELESFAYTVSHDLKNPLAAIEGFGKLLEGTQGPKLDAQGQDLLGSMLAATDRMRELVEDLLQFSRAGRAEVHRETVDISAMAHKTANTLRKTDPDRKVRWILNDGLKAEGDPKLLQVVMENLMGNAWKYTGKTAEAVIEFGAVPRGGSSSYYVKDNGAGFDLARATNLFQPFARFHKKADFPGTGVGLSTVARIIHKHGGRLWAESEPGRGAAFYFTLG